MEDQGSGNTIPLNRLMFATDFSAASDGALEYAVSIAKSYSAQIYVAHVIDLKASDLISSEPSTEVLKQAHEDARQKIAGMLTTRGFPSDQCHIIVTHGVVPDALIGIVRQRDIDLAVLGTHGRRAFKKLMLGSIAEEFFRMAPCAVLTVGQKAVPTASELCLKHVLYPIKVAPDPSDAAKYAVSLAERYGAKLTIMNVMENMPSSANTREDFPMPAGSWIEDHISKKSDLRSRLYFERGFGPAAKALLEFASNAAVDVIVVGVSRQDPTITAHLPKSDTAYEIVSRAPCPVLTVR